MTAIVHYKMQKHLSCTQNVHILYNDYPSVLVLCSTIDSWAGCKDLKGYSNGNNGKSHRKEQLMLLILINSMLVFLLLCRGKNIENSGHISVLQLIHDSICIV